MVTTISVILAVLLLALTVQGCHYFLIALRVKFVEWLFFNPCATGNLVFLAGYLTALITGNRTVLHVAVLPMFFFGTLGMFTLPWRGMNVFPQTCHILMTLNVAWSLGVSFSSGQYAAVALGLLLSVLVFASFIAVQQRYVRLHPKEFARILLGKPQTHKK